MSNPEYEKEIEEIRKKIKENQKFIIKSLIAFTAITALFYSQEKWTFIKIFLFSPLAILWMISILITLAIAHNIKELNLIIKTPHKINDYLKREKNAAILIGDIYAVTENKTQKTEIWFTEDPTGWDLHEKFGWWQYKRRVKPYKSSTHEIKLISKNVIFDNNLHNNVNKYEANLDERELRKARYDKFYSNTEKYNIYVIHDRIKKQTEILEIAKTQENDFLREKSNSEYLSVIPACNDTHKATQFELQEI